MSRRITATLSLAGAALAVAEATRAGRGRSLDDRLFRWANREVRHPVLDILFKGVTELGSLWASLGAAGALAARGHRRTAARAVGAAGLTWALGQGLKRVFRRLRPYEGPAPIRLLIARPAGASWPSSHPAVFLTFVTVAARELGLSGRARSGLGGVALLVGASRVYLGVHYPADVAGGLLLGRAVADLLPA